MMKRDQILQILSAASDESLQKACSALGIDCGHAYGEEGGVEMGGRGDPLESWNETRISMPQSHREPLVNPRSYLKPIQQTQPATRRMDYMPKELLEETEDFAAPPPGVRGMM